MLTYLSGKLAFKSPKFVTIDIMGIGFKIFVPLSTYYKLPEINTDTKLFIYLYAANNVFALYGFLTKAEMDTFEILLSVTNIGPRIAINILSELSAGELKAAILEEDLKILISIPGVGRKTAQRIFLEIKEKIEGVLTDMPYSSGKREIVSDAISALVSLGYSQSSSREAVDKVTRSLKDEFSLEKIIKQALDFFGNRSIRDK